MRTHNTLSGEPFALKVATWNLKWAAPRSPRWASIAARLGAVTPDVTVLTEVDLRTTETWPHRFNSGPHPLVRQPHRSKVEIVSRLPMRLVDAIGSPNLPLKNFVAVDVDTPAGTLRVIGIVIRWNQKDEFVEALPKALEKTVTNHTILAGDFNLRIPGGALSHRLVESLHAAGLQVVSAGHHSVLDGKRPLIDHIAVTKNLCTSDLTVWPRRDPAIEGGTKEVTDHAGCSAIVTHHAK